MYRRTLANLQNEPLPRLVFGRILISEAKTV